MSSLNLFSDYKPKKAVSWFSLNVLFYTLIRERKVTKASDFREKSGEFGKAQYDLKVSENEEVWIDYVSDTGDGFSETLTVLNLVTKDLQINEHLLKQGRLLVFGGDQTYPYSSYDNYSSRLFGPFLTAQTINLNKKFQNIRGLFSADPERDLIAVPGNHDWYDGLSSFIEFFCTGKVYGSYKSVQNNSYGAVKVHENTHIWYLDIQLSEDINVSQINYFTSLCLKFDENSNKAGKDEIWNIILCVPQPFWLQKSIDWDDRLFTHMERFVTEIFLLNNPYKLTNNNGKIFKRMLSLKLVLTGDVHHYHRFKLRLDSRLNQEVFIKGKYIKPINENLVLLTAGGGGAYTFPTHNLDFRLLNKPFQSRINNLTLTKEFVYPSEVQSYNLISKTYLDILLKNFSFILVPIVFYLLLGFLMFDNLPPLRIRDINKEPVNLLPLITLFVIGTFSFLYLITNTLDKNFKRLNYLGYFSWACIVILMALFNFLIYFGGLELYKMLYDSKINHNLEYYYYYPIILVLSIISCAMFGYYLYLAHINLRLHDNEVFSASKINKYKNFLRMKLSKDRLDIYPIGVPDVSNKLLNLFKNKEYEDLKSNLRDTKIELIEEVICVDLD
ncbi:MAG: metallophosphoesterase [Saprospiraceae bacterium]